MLQAYVLLSENLWNKFAQSILIYVGERILHAFEVYTLPFQNSKHA